MTIMKIQTFENVSSSKDGDFPASHVWGCRYDHFEAFFEAVIWSHILYFCFEDDGTWRVIPFSK